MDATQTIDPPRDDVRHASAAPSGHLRSYAVAWVGLTAAAALIWLTSNIYGMQWLFRGAMGGNAEGPTNDPMSRSLSFGVALLVVVASVSAPWVARRHSGIAMVLASAAFAGLLNPQARVVDAMTVSALVGVGYISILRHRQGGWIAAALALIGPLAMSWSGGRTHLTVLGFDNQSESWGSDQRVITPLLWVVAVLLVLMHAHVVRTRSLQSAAAKVLLRRSSEVEREAVAVDERARLARDLHDVVAHRVSLIAVRAESAPFAHPDLDTEAKRLLAETADDARAALEELREVLGVLHRTTERAPRLPQPGAGQIPALIDQARAAGATVEVAGAIGKVSDATGTTAYRVVQEALTNARRHAPDKPATLTFSGHDDLVIRIVNPATGTDMTPGRGLTGMRERVELAGGQLDVGHEGTWFVVEARLPRETP